MKTQVENIPDPIRLFKKESNTPKADPLSNASLDINKAVKKPANKEDKVKDNTSENLAGKRSMDNLNIISNTIQATEIPIITEKKNPNFFNKFLPSFALNF